MEGLMFGILRYGAWKIKPKKKSTEISKFTN